MSKRIIWVLTIILSIPYFAYADDLMPAKEKFSFPQVNEWLKISGSLYEYFLWQDNTYFNRLKGDSFLETTARLGAKATPTDNLEVNLGVIGEQVAGDANEYTIVKNHEFITKLEFANFSARKLLGQPLALTVGRQNLEFGDGFILYDFYSDKRAVWTASMRSLYAARLNFEIKPFTFDAFSGRVDRGYKSYEAYYKDFKTYQGRRDISGGNIHFDSEKLGAWDLLCVYKEDRSELASDTVAISTRVAKDFLKAPFKLTLQAEAVPEFGRTNVVDNSLGNTRRDREGFGGHIDLILSFEKMFLTPEVKLRYAYFSADNPDTDKNEGFDPLFYGFRDWGDWFMGSINSYNLYNTNERVYMFELGLHPTDKTKVRLFYHDFLLNRQINADAGKNFSREVNLVLDWFPKDWFFCGVEFGFAHPLKAARAYVGSDDNTLEVVSWIGLNF